MNDRRSFLNLLGATALPAMAAAAVANAQTTAPMSLEGAWFLENTPGVVPGLPPEAQVSPFSEIALFGAGGVLLETNSLLHNNSYAPGNPSPINVSGSDGLGSWTRNAAGQVDAVFYKFLTDGSGRHVGYLKVNGTVYQQDANQLTAEWVVEFQFFDPQLPRIGSTVSSKGTRIS